MMISKEQHALLNELDMAVGMLHAFATLELKGTTIWKVVVPGRDNGFYSWFLIQDACRYYSSPEDAAKAYLEYYHHWIDEAFENEGGVFK